MKGFVQRSLMRVLPCFLFLAGCADVPESYQSDTTSSDYETQRAEQTVRLIGQVNRAASFEEFSRLRSLNRVRHFAGDDYIEGKRREWYIGTCSDLTHEIQTLIEVGKLRLGMTADQCRASWGSPHDVNRTVTALGVHEQWVYDLEGVTGTEPQSRVYVYFEDGILTSWQD